MKKSIPVDDFSRGEQEQLFRFQRLDHDSGYNVREPHRHNYFEIFHFVQDGGEHMLDFTVRQIRKDSLHFVAPGQVHMLRRNRTTAGYVLIFSEAFLYFQNPGDPLLRDFPAFNKLTLPVLNPDENFSRELENLAGLIEAEVNARHPYRQQIIADFLRIYLKKCIPYFESGENYSGADGSTQNLIRKFHLLIEKHFAKLHKVKSYAEKLNVTPNYLNEVTKRITGKTALELIQERILLEAKRHLLHSELTSQEIAFALNYEDPSYFSRFFRNNTKLSPNSYRKFIREKYQG